MYSSLIRQIQDIFGVIYDFSSTAFGILMSSPYECFSWLLDVANNPIFDTIMSILGLGILDDIYIKVINIVVEGLPRNGTMLGYFLMFALLWGIVVHVIKWLYSWIPVFGT